MDLTKINADSLKEWTLLDKILFRIMHQNCLGEKSLKLSNCKLFTELWYDFGDRKESNKFDVLCKELLDRDFKLCYSFENKPWGEVGFIISW